MSDIGQRLKEERNRLGLSQGEAAKLGGASKNTQLSYESGKSSPNADYLVRLADEGFDIFYILTAQRVDNLGSPKVRRYDSRAEAVLAAVNVQQRLGLMLPAERIKVLAEYAWEYQVDEDELVRFVRAAHSVMGEELPEGD